MVHIRERTTRASAHVPADPETTLLGLHESSNRYVLCSTYVQSLLDSTPVCVSRLVDEQNTSNKCMGLEDLCDDWRN